MLIFVVRRLLIKSQGTLGYKLLIEFSSTFEFLIETIKYCEDLVYTHWNLSLISVFKISHL